MALAAQATQWLSPAHAAADLAQMNTMLARLRVLQAELKSLPATPRPFTFNSMETDGRHHRVVVSRTEPLLEGAELSVVAFFGLKSPTADAEELTRVDLELIDELPKNPNLLTYSSLELERGGQWGNLVLFSHADAIGQWREGARHRRAVDELTHKAYLAIRLHNGKLTGGLAPSANLAITQTKYFNYVTPG